jgi:hypothetical protein
VAKLDRGPGTWKFTQGVKQFLWIALAVRRLQLRWILHADPVLGGER